MASRVAKGPPPPAAAKTGTDVAEAKKVKVAPVTRREFLFYIWGASIAMILGQSTGILVWFMLPRFREGEFGGVFTGDATKIPEVGTPPANVPAGKYWLSNTEEGIVALYKVCTHLGCLYAWVETAGRFECPCHGSKYERDGTWIEGPAPRSLDRFTLTITLQNGTVLTSNEIGDPIPVPDKNAVSQFTIDTGNRIKRPGRV
ncbi:MAG: ubiquinol-cytochrome c reductase iron-sulfur subunit [Chloroflexi bacterium]|nr:ubiquinol-cytochrome c reductase iron-sulfur subunit [Chloroflexota bacterium]